MSLTSLFKKYKGFLVMYALILLVQTILNLKMPELISNILKVGIIQNDKNNIYLNGLYMLILSILIFICSFIAVRLLTTMTFKTTRDARYQMYKKFQEFSSIDIQDKGTSSYITRVTNDIDQVSNVMMNTMYFIVSAPIMLIGATFMAIKINLKISIVFIILIPLVALLAGIIIYLALPNFKAQRLFIDKINKLVRESVIGIRVIRAFDKENYEIDRFDEVNKGYSSSLFRANISMGLFPALIPVISNISSIAILLFGAYLIQNGNLNVEYLITLQQYAINVLVSLIMISFAIAIVPQALIAKDRIDEMFSQEILDPDRKGNKDISSIESLEFKNVSITLNHAEYPIIDNISFKVNRGSTLAITGSTGSGKSSIVNNIVRLIKETKGTMLVNDIDVNEFNLEEYRNRVSFVPQVKKLFKGTIRSNILFGKPDATDDEIIQALKMAGAYEFVEKLPEFLDAVVEKNGENFSGGQKQRLCMARAFVKEADIYIFDDSFSALDYKTESLIRANLEKYKKDSIKIIISQRESSLINADAVILMENGSILDMGTHQVLQDRSLAYREIFNKEKGGQM